MSAYHDQLNAGFVCDSLKYVKEFYKLGTSTLHFHALKEI